MALQCTHRSQRTVKTPNAFDALAEWAAGVRNAYSYFIVGMAEVVMRTTHLVEHPDWYASGTVRGTYLVHPPATTISGAGSQRNENGEENKTSIHRKKIKNTHTYTQTNTKTDTNANANTNTNSKTPPLLANQNTGARTLWDTQQKNGERILRTITAVTFVHGKRGF